jgi:hypothetical protein
MGWGVACLALAWALSAAPARAEGDEAPREGEATVEDKATAEALEILKRASDFLAGQERFRFDAYMGFDVVQDNGQKLEFGSTRKITLRRPDRLRVEAQRRDGEEQSLFFDGKQLAVHFPRENAYASVEKPGTLDQALDYLVEDLGAPAPLSDFLYSSFYAEAVEHNIQEAYYVGDARIDRFLCQHVALRTEEVDAQLWFEKGEQPLPFRVVITYREAEDSPQFWAQFLNWDLSPETPDTLFTYEPAPGTERIPFAVPKRNAPVAMEAR